MGNLGFWSFIAACGVPALAALGVVFGVLWYLWRDRMSTAEVLPPDLPEVPFHPHDRVQTLKGVISVLVMLIFFTTSLPRVRLIRGWPPVP